MAQRVNVVHVSDLSGVDITDNDAPTVAFSWDGTDYSIDLTAKEAEKFYKVIAPYISAGTKTVKKKTGTAKKSTTSGPSAADVREWAKTNGYDVPDRGRIPGDVREAFDAAN